jgi:hypothetical protein
MIAGISMTDMPVMGHITVALLACGFFMFLSLIFKKTRKVVRRGNKARRRQKKFLSTNTPNH